MTGRRFVIALVAAALALGACGSSDGRVLPPPSSTSSTAGVATTERIDYSQVALAPLPGETTTTEPISVGTAEIRGGVEGPTGLIPGAVVRFERLVGDAVQRTDVTTGADGRYVLSGVPGGRYRVRAYFVPLLTMDGPEVFYLADGDTRDLDLRTREFTGLVVTAGVTPSAPVVGQGVNLVVRVTERIVDADGVGREGAVSGATVSVTSTGWEPVLDTAAPSTTTTGPDTGIDVLATDAAGEVVFEFTCTAATAVTATALVDVGTGPVAYPLEVPPCAPRTTTTTATSVVGVDPAVPGAPPTSTTTVP